MPLSPPIPGKPEKYNNIIDRRPEPGTSRTRSNLASLGAFEGKARKPLEEAVAKSLVKNGITDRNPRVIVLPTNSPATPSFRLEPDMQVFTNAAREVRATKNEEKARNLRVRADAAKELGMPEPLLRDEPPDKPIIFSSFVLPGNLNSAARERSVHKISMPGSNVIDQEVLSIDPAEAVAEKPISPAEKIPVTKFLVGKTMPRRVGGWPTSELDLFEANANGTPLFIDFERFKRLFLAFMDRPDFCTREASALALPVRPFATARPIARSNAKRVTEMAKRGLARRIATNRPNHIRLAAAEKAVADAEGSGNIALLDLAQQELARIRKAMSSKPYLDEHIDKVPQSFTSPRVGESKAVLFCLVDPMADFDDEMRLMAMSAMLMPALRLEALYDHMEVKFIHNAVVRGPIDEDKVLFGPDNPPVVPSYGLKELKRIVLKSYRPEDNWHVFAVHISQGDTKAKNQVSQMELCKQELTVGDHSVLALCNFFAHVEIANWERREAYREKYAFPSDKPFWTMSNRLISSHDNLSVIRVVNAKKIASVFDPLLKSKPAEPQPA